ncbi:MAG: SAM-dependent methyltransferase [Thiotrichaceae bacterium]|nr:MAG: SAM-dependent methyltransferase [Thiotrichaceae bacterium]
METTKLKKFAQYARRSLIEQVSNKLKLVLNDDSAARRENAEAVKKLEEQIKIHSKKHVIEQVAYIWFNRFCALRFMDVNRYTRIGVVSPAEGQFQPEILAEAKMGHIDEGMVPDTTRQQIFTLLDGTSPSKDPQSEAYRLLVVAACNDYYKAMPYMFERIADYTELLMPDDLLSGNSVLAYTREAMTPDICEDVEVIGWLYQFYISEKKDEVFDGLKKNKKITPENIPAATQLFTPHWIVRYLVENSLGRLWMLNRPDSGLLKQMDYYIKPERPEADFLQISSPEEIKICDPACGSGHMLTYAFDLLYAIYEEEGYEPADIPEKILTNNLYGVEIDERAGELAAFALTMKARAKQRRFFRKQVHPNICVLENIQFEEDELKEYMEFIGRDLFTTPLLTTLSQFEETNNFGSLITPEVTDVASMLHLLSAKDVSEQLFLNETHEKVLKTLRQADYLIPKYHVVIANPPYKSKKDLNDQLQMYMAFRFPRSKGDLFACFIEKGLELTLPFGYCSMITMQAWLFIDSYEELRAKILDYHSILNLIQIGFNSFPELNSKFALAAAFTIIKDLKGQYGDFISLNNASKTADKKEIFFKEKNALNIYNINSDEFAYIEGTPISFETPKALRHVFHSAQKLREIAEPRQGMATGKNDKFVRIWTEVSFNRIGFNYETRQLASSSGLKWFPYNKGGGFRKWYGNQIFIVNWENDGYEIQNFTDSKGKLRSRPQNKEYYFKESITWSLIGLSFGPRYNEAGFLFDVGGSSAFPDKENIDYILAFMGSKISSECLISLNPTLNFQVGDIQRLPLIIPKENDLKFKIDSLSQENIKIAKEEWNCKESSWGFKQNELLKYNKNGDFRQAFHDFCSYWDNRFWTLHSNEEKINSYLFNIYQLEDISPDVDLKHITLLDDVAEIIENKLVFTPSEVINGFLSYAVGCMFGRYSLDKKGLIVANQGETLEEYFKQIHNPSYPADDDNVIPMLDGDWFTDDITDRFFKFLRVTFGEEHYEENLKFIEHGIGKDVRKYFLKDFYNDHVKRYKKRPIYWMFSSPKGSFNALIYMHRYRPDTVSVVLNDYLREFNAKLSSRKQHLEAINISASASQSEKTKALKAIEKLNKMIVEMEEYERDVLYPLATEQLEIDLDDGVKVNYNKFGTALKKITGLSGK